MITILFISSNPQDTDHLAIDEEIRDIDQKLQGTKFRESFDIKSHWAVRISDLQQLFLRYQPTIVHFSGHGSKKSEIILQDESGKNCVVPPKALRDLFSQLSKVIKCVVLNACYSKKQAEIISNSIDCVIGMAGTVSDQAARSFSSAFYQALGYDQDVKTAFELGCSEIQLQDLGEHGTPIILSKRVDPRSMTFLSMQGNNAVQENRFALPDLEKFFTDLKSKQHESQKLAAIYGLVNSMFEMIMYLFIVSTIRSYEEAILKDVPRYKKKTKEIANIVSDKFTAPSTTTIYDLARRCYHLVDSEAPGELVSMKESFGKQFVLGAIGKMLDELEHIFHTDGDGSRIINKAQISKSLINYVIPEVLKYGKKIDELRDNAEEDEKGDIPEIRVNFQIWESASEMLATVVDSMFSQEFALESLDKIDTANRKYIVNIRRYANKTVSVSQKSISFEEMDEESSEISTTVINMTRDENEISLRLFPFLIIKNDKFYYYKRTRASGYEFFSISDSNVFIERTKRKFSHSLFGIGVRGIQQSLFWTEVLPALNDTNGVKANIPYQDYIKFVGRKKQITTIKRQIIEIPNQDGIVYGVGGVGKTALMIQLSHDLYKEQNIDNILFNNIVWVSAKRNYYNPSLDIVQPRSRRVESLNHVLSAILAFFEYEGLEGYSLEDKKNLVLDLLLENKVLLVLDNFEAVSKAEHEAIIEFFGIETKYFLRKNPDQFKVIITSREQIPSGFHQVILTGLDSRESENLMEDLYEQYRMVAPELTKEQKQKIFEVTSGIPVVIKHCFGQIYEYNKPFSTVVNAIVLAKTAKVVEFSFEEVFKIVRDDQCQLEIILLLEYINCPLLVRQMAEILNRFEGDIENRIPSLYNFQCIKRDNYGLEEKYEINPEVRLFTKRLTHENLQLLDEIKKKIVRNFTIDRQMDYTTEEVGIVTIFNNYISQGQYPEGEDFINQEIKKRDSVLLRYQYAKYLKEQKGDIDNAIAVLENILEPSNNHPTVLRLLFKCYVDMDIPKFEKGSIYVAQIENTPIEDDKLKLEIAEFYVKWSTSIKIKREVNPDPIIEILRQRRYKELADKALFWLDQVNDKNHHSYYLLSQSYFNKWDNAKALDAINKAISLCSQDLTQLPLYSYLQNLITKQQQKYDR